MAFPRGAMFVIMVFPDHTHLLFMVLIIPSDNASSDPDIKVAVSLRFRLSSDPYII